MPRGALPEHVQAFLREPRPAIIGSLLGDGSPSTVVTWYLWLGGTRLMLSMQKGGFRERNLARNGRVALTVLGKDWYDHVSLRGRIVEMRGDPNWVDLDTLSQHYWGVPYPRDAGYQPSTGIVEVDAWLEFHSQGRANVKANRANGGPMWPGLPAVLARADAAIE
jgi:Pyridoxamine 5'-phosphate oxidase